MGQVGDRSPTRYVAGLLEAMAATGLTEGTVVTRSAAFERTVDGSRIRGVPLGEWLLRSRV